jgi:hypothetical protein
MAAVSDSIAVGGSPALVLPQGSYQFVCIGNNGSSTAFVKFLPDGSNVTTLTGLPLAPGAGLVLDQDASPVLSHGVWAVCASGESTSISVQAY